METLRALVIEDSLTIRKRIIEILQADPAIEVVGEAGDGKTGIELCEKLRPSVIALDVMLPVMSGVAVTEYVMAYCPTPILIVSASTNRGKLYRTYDALAAGAIDVLEKPLGDELDGAWEKQLVAQLKMVARVPVITHPRAKLGRLGMADAEQARSTPLSRTSADIGVIALGASTGGPAALLELIRALPPSLAMPILIVIHIGEAFAMALPEWLGDQTGRPVRYAEDGEPLYASNAQRVVLAPPGRHLVVDGQRLRLPDGAERHFCRPSVDVLFESLATSIGSGAIACLLTGMGKDGAQGLLAVRQAGGETIAQDEATSVVFGMPGEAIRIGAAKYIAPLGQIPALVESLVGTSKRKERAR